MSYVAQLNKDKKTIKQLVKKKIKRRFGPGNNKINKANLASNLIGATNTKIKPTVFKSIYQIAAAAAAAARKQRESERLSNKSSSTVDSAFHKNHETSSNSICLTKSQEGASEDKISAAS